MGKSIPAVKDDLARRRLQKLEQGSPNRRLAAAAFPHQSNGLTALDLETDSVHRLDVINLPAQQTPKHGKPHPQISHLKKRHRATTCRVAAKNQAGIKPEAERSGPIRSGVSGLAKTRIAPPIVL